MIYQILAFCLDMGNKDFILVDYGVSSLPKVIRLSGQNNYTKPPIKLFLAEKVPILVGENLGGQITLFKILASKDKARVVRNIVTNFIV